MKFLSGRGWEGDISRSGGGVVLSGWNGSKRPLAVGSEKSRVLLHPGREGGHPVENVPSTPRPPLGGGGGWMGSGVDFALTQRD